MTIQILWPWELPEKIEGLAVVADIFAATTNIASFLGRGVAKLLLVNHDLIKRVKRDHPKSLVVGESHILPRDFFHLSNAPTVVDKASVRGRSIIFMTANGTRVIERAILKGASPVISISFTNLESVARWIQDNKIKSVILIPSGTIDLAYPTLPEIETPEDLKCIEALQSLLEGKPHVVKEKITAVKTLLETIYGVTENDPNFWPVFAFNRFNVVPVCRQIEAGLFEVTDASRGQRWKSRI